MSEQTVDKTGGISNDPLEIRTALEEIYKDLVGEEEKLFPNNYSLFCAGLTYGLLHKKQHDSKPTYAFTKIFAISDNASKELIEVVYRLLDDGKKEKNEIWQQMLSIADGGVFALNDIYKSYKSLTIPQLFEEAKRLWPNRVKDLYNINI